ncbi:MAG: hypothetical protein IT542_02410 [Rubellimicrobium sp.]|nr:hypothetical protein [Rubellimicrobium sp.]
MIHWLHEFREDESGAVTVDWVVLTGGILAFGILVASMISQGATDSAGAVGSRLATAQVPDVHF